MNEPCPKCGRVSTEETQRAHISIIEDGKPVVVGCLPGCYAGPLPKFGFSGIAWDSSYPDVSTIKMVRIPKPDPEEAE
mgnify:CR=1 FL=1